MELKNGTYLQGGKYQILSTLGQGGFGITYKASQQGLDREVAIKEFYMSDICLRDFDTSRVTLSSAGSSELWNGFRSKFIKEAKTIASLNHPNIVKIIDVFEENDTAYYAMEFITGGSLKSQIKSKGVLSEDKAMSVIEKVGDALTYIHSKNILHLDIKPDNIMMTDPVNPVIIDFGISKRYDESGSETSMMQAGRSRGYAPIEQYKLGGLSTFSPATDVYSLAATMYFMLGGQRPPEPSDIYERGLPALSGVSADTMDVLKKGMAVRKSNRPQSVREFLRLFKIRHTAQAATFDVDNFRLLIESLEADKNYKEAYNRCLECIQNGNDVEFSREKASELVAKMRQKNKIQSVGSVMLAIIVSIVVLTISLMIQ